MTAKLKCIYARGDADDVILVLLNSIVDDDNIYEIDNLYFNIGLSLQCTTLGYSSWLLLLQ